MNKNMVAIPLAEYKELLLKDKPSDNEKQILNKIYELINQCLEYEPNSYSYQVIKNGHFKDRDDFLKEMFTIIKILDFEKYMQIWNYMMTKERERKAQDEKINQMNEAKEMRQENE